MLCVSLMLIGGFLLSVAFGDICAGLSFTSPCPHFPSINLSALGAARHPAQLALLSIVFGAGVFFFIRQASFPRYA